MSSIIEENRAVAEFLSAAKPAHAKAVLQNADKEVVKIFSECCQNVLYNDLPLCEETKHKLKKHKSSLKKLAGRWTTNKQKKFVLKTKGHLFAADLLKTAISFLDQNNG
jgi:hypothetical protein